MPSRKSSTADAAPTAAARPSRRGAATTAAPTDGQRLGARRPGGTTASRRPRQGALGLDWSQPALVAGVDEAGRGPLAGPVVAAAVILDDLDPIEGLADSKVLTAKARERLAEEIRARALCCSVAEASVQEIEEINILQATMLAMRRAVEGLRLKPDRVLVDGNRLPVLTVAAEAIIGGDATVQAISAASILAKVHRDRLCVELHALHPDYGFHEHKGYSTPEHLAALRRHGACAAHRRTFAPVREVIAASVVQTVTVETTTVDPFGGVAFTTGTLIIETTVGSAAGGPVDVLEILTVDAMTAGAPSADRAGADRAPVDLSLVDGVGTTSSVGAAA